MVEWISYACVSALLSGLMPSFLKTGMQKSPSALGAALLSAVALVFAGVIAGLEGTFDTLLEYDNATLLYLVLSGALLGVYWLCLSFSLGYGEVSRAVPVVNLSGSAAIGLSAMLLIAPVGVWKLCCIAMLLLGTLLLETRSTQGGDVRWVLYAFLALLAAAVREIVDARLLAQVPESARNVVCTAVAAVLLLCAAVLGDSSRAARKMSVEGWVFLVLSGTAVGVSWLCDSRAAALGDPSYLAPIACAWFPAALLGARLLHGEKLSATAMFGIVLVLLGMFGLLLNL